jgi:hypothetical protein
MTPQPKKAEILIIIATIAVLGAVWALNGYEDTWLYVTAAVIALPVTSLAFGMNNNYNYN